MKKLVSRIFVLAALTAALLTVTAFAAEGGVGVVNTDALRLRTEPSTSSATAAYLNSGDEVEILEDLGDWYYVSYNGATGYVYAVYVTFNAGSTATAALSGESVAGRVGAVTGDQVNFRSGPSTDYAVITTLSEGTEMTILGITDGWCEMDWAGQYGYVKADYVSVDGIPLVDPRGVVTGDCVNVRDTASTDGGIVTKVYAGSIVDLIALENGWYKVSVDGTVGYIRSDFLRVYAGDAGSGLGSDIVASAMDYLGAPYVYGGSSSRGFDCSGFTMYIFGLYGYSLPHSATSQWYDSGTYVDQRSDLQPGDLVLFCDPSRSNGKACSHVGIYVGGGEFIHASSSGGVKISSLDDNYYNTYYVGGKRVA